MKQLFRTTYLPMTVNNQTPKNYLPNQGKNCKGLKIAVANPKENFLTEISARIAILRTTPFRIFNTLVKEWSRTMRYFGVSTNA